MTNHRVSLVTTVLNEYGSLPAWLDAIARQSRLPDECIIVDGGSRDGTVEFLRSTSPPFELHLVSLPGANISTGRNAGIRAATGDVIVVTDAGTTAEQNWLARLVEPLENSPDCDLVAGFFIPETSGAWSTALAAATLPDAEEIEPEAFLPSSRSVAFRRRWFDGGFGYPEWLDYCEDLIFDLQLRRAAAHQVTRVDARVRFAPRSGPAAFFRQYFRYARGDGKAGLFGRRHLVRYGAYGVACLILARRRPLELAMLALAISANLAKVAKRLRRRGVDGGLVRLSGLFLLAALQVGVGDAAKMLGYPFGLAWRIRRDRSLKLWKSGWQFRSRGGDLRRT